MSEVLVLPSKADIVLRRVVCKHLARHARQGVTWANPDYEQAVAAGITGAGLVVEADGRRLPLDIKCAEDGGFDGALRRLEEFGALPWRGTILGDDETLSRSGPSP